MQCIDAGRHINSFVSNPAVLVPFFIHPEKHEVIGDPKPLVQFVCGLALIHQTDIMNSRAEPLAFQREIMAPPPGHVVLLQHENFLSCPG